MNPREKILAGMIGLILLLFTGVLGIKALLLRPIKEIDRQSADLRQRLDKLHQDQRAFFSADDYLQKQIGPRTLSAKPDQATARAGEMLAQAIARAGLNETAFTLVPISQHRLRGALEVGWTVQGEGQLSKLVDLLFILEKSPPLHRLENLSLSPADRTGRLRIRFGYLTLVLEPPAAPPFLSTANLVAFNQPDRERYQIILRRNLLQPFVAPPAASGRAGLAGPAPSPAPGPENFRVVSLSEWSGQTEIHVRDLAKNVVQCYHPGDAMAGGTILQVDYRPMPFPNKPGLLSFSRVLLKIGAEYWAIEHGQTFAEKHQLTAEQLPTNLTAAQPAPAHANPR